MSKAAKVKPTVKKIIKKSPSVAEKKVRDRIVQASIEAFLENGPVDVTLSEIAKRAKVRYSLLLYYFPTKDLLAKETVLFILEDLRARTVRALEGSPARFLDTLDRYLRVPFQWAKSDPQRVSVWLYFYYQASVSKEYQAMNDEIRQVGRKRIEALVFEGIAKKAISDRLVGNVPALAWAIQGILTGNLLMGMTESGVTMDQMEASTLSTVYSVLGINT